MALIVLAGCRKSDNEKVPEFAKIPMPLFQKDRKTSLIISSETPDAFNAKFSVGLFYLTGEQPSKFDIVIRKNGVNSSAKTFRTDITTFPTDVTVTGVQLRQMFGPILLGDQFDIGADVTTTSGKKYPAFSTDAATYGAGVASVAGSIPVIRYEAVCPFKIADYGAIGTTVPYTVLEDGWNDYPKGSTVDVTIIDATHLSFFYPTDVDVKPIVITVDPLDNTTSVARVTFGGYGDDFLYTAESVPNSLSNAVFPCKLEIGVNLSFPGFGTGVIRLKKK